MSTSRFNPKPTRAVSTAIIFVRVPTEPPPATARSAAPDPSSPEQDNQAEARRKAGWGTLWALVWLCLFTCGLSIPTHAIRVALGSVAPTAAGAATPPINQPPETVPSTLSLVSPSGANAPVDLNCLSLQSIAACPPVLRTGVALAVLLFCFTPLNIGLLTLTAGLVGGFSSNVAFHLHQKNAAALVGETRGGLGPPAGTDDGSTDLPARSQPADTAEREARRLRYLSENPLGATLRSFVVYLAFISGAYLVGNDPFTDVSGAQYAKLAGTISLLGFGVGYDPTRFQDLVGLFSRAGRKET